MRTVSVMLSHDEICLLAAMLNAAMLLANGDLPKAVTQTRAGDTFFNALRSRPSLRRDDDVGELNGLESLSRLLHRAHGEVCDGSEGAEDFPSRGNPRAN